MSGLAGIIVLTPSPVDYISMSFAFSPQVNSNAMVITLKLEELHYLQIGAFYK